jgi:hypothetical protein
MKECRFRRIETGGKDEENQEEIATTGGGFGHSHQWYGSGTRPEAARKMYDNG